MPLSSSAKRFVGQPINQKRIELNPQHWLADRVIFVHTGRTALLRGRPVLPSESAPFDKVLGARTASTVTSAFDSSLNILPDGTAYETYETGGHPGLMVSLSVWVNRDANSGVGVGYINSTATAGGFIRIVQGGVNNRISVQTSTATAGAAVNTSQDEWSQGVGSFSSTVLRKVWLNGANPATSTQNRAAQAIHDRITIARSLDGTTYGLTAGLGVSGIALPMVINGVFNDDEVAHLYEEQRTRPWALFKERPTQIWLGAAVNSPTITLNNINAYNITSSGFNVRGNATWA